MWKARNKTDLAIEVWEKLDCESIGAREIEAIEIVVAEEYGQQAVDSPMRTARLLADEGAVLRHAEIMELYLAREANRPYEAALRDVLDVRDLRSALTSIRRLDALRRRYLSANDREGIRLTREAGIHARELAAETAGRARVDAVARHVNAEIAQWLTVWLQTPEIFEDWVSLRQRSADFVDYFGHVRHEDE